MNKFSSSPIREVCEDTNHGVKGVIFGMRNMKQKV